MKTKAFASAGSLAFVGLLAFTACGSDNATGEAGNSESGSGSESSVSGTLSGIGASSQQAAITAWESGFASANPDASVQYSPDGSGAGRKALLAGGADFAGSDAHLTEDEYQQSQDVCGPDGAMNIPVYISPIAVSFNLPGIDSLNLDAETIAKIFKGDIKKWNDEAIASQNEGVDLPDTNITVVHRSDDSGTTENFTEYLAAAAGDTWGQEPDGNWPSAYAGESNKGTSGVVDTTTSTEGAITYADASAVGDLGKVNVVVNGEPVELSPEAAAKTVEISDRVGVGNENDMSIDINRTPDEAGAYPIVLVSYHVVCSSYEDQATADLVKAYESYVVSEQGQQDAADAASSAPLTDALLEDAQKAIDSIEVAS
ncbi:phosphate ABC transporter substrate-binding protein PstS [Rothia aerolata]|uniref:Phosphate-binding protein n=1 Tax=Rothia aerolata TaxID=1812262 RepID=A0A917IUE2_9MICC|nr:phosphate ABC transporter substrate-binding protein PstS [Rothia aerolata]GGH62057.1 phosphate-binding protein PstS [Rothia aerolata]